MRVLPFDIQFEYETQECICTRETWNALHIFVGPWNRAVKLSIVMKISSRDPQLSVCEECQVWSIVAFQRHS